MILVVLGMSKLRFDRLLAAVGSARIDEELVIQHGISEGGPGEAEYHDFLALEEIAALMQRARLVVTHAGVGSIMTALGQGKRPIVFPRLSRFSEAVDDHQLTFAQRLASEGLVTVAEDAESLDRAIHTEDGSSAVRIGPDRRLVDELHGYFEAALASRTPR
jgi:UDP-N-acetylglucosamine transferase subunit ALG13